MACILHETSKRGGGGRRWVGVGGALLQQSKKMAAMKNDEYERRIRNMSKVQVLASIRWLPGAHIGYVAAGGEVIARA
jgi:hypothetical protein